MSLTFSYTQKGEYTLPEPGTYNARCVRVIDLGTQQTTFQGQVKTPKQVMIQWELFGDEGAEEKPFIISERYNCNPGTALHPKGKLRPMLASWRGRDFTPEEEAAFDAYNLLGKDCMVSIIHSTGEKTYANVASVAPPMKGMLTKLKGFQATTDLLYFDLSKAGQIGFQTDYGSLPEWIQNIIHKSKEWPDVMRKMHGGTAPQAQPATDGMAVELDDEELATMPF